MIIDAIKPLPDVLNHQNCLSHFDFKLGINNEGNKCIVLPFHDRNLGNSMIKALHGGVIALALEAAGHLALSDMGNAYSGAQIEIAHTTFLTRTAPETLWAHAQPVRTGARFLRLEAAAYQDHGKVAQSMLTAVLARANGT